MLKTVWIGSVICSTAVVALFSHPVVAQSVSDERLATCAQIENPLQRLVCFDELAANGNYQQAEQSQANNRGRGKGRGAERSQGRGQDRGQSESNRADDFGREHRQERQSEDADKRYIEIVKTTKDPYGRWIFELANGQRWQQTDSNTYQLPDGVDYYIERGVLNSFYLGRSDINSRIKVKRID